MLKTLLLAGAFLCLSFAASAAECEFPFDDVIGQFSKAGAPVVIIDPTDLPEIVANVEAMTGQDLGDATRGFFAQAGGKILLGLEVDDCLIEPINLGPVPAVSVPLSGKDEAGHIGA
jgi:hypothetical protein